jgi:hypothetical protein
LKRSLPIRELATNIWVHDDELKLPGASLGLRMTVVRLNDGNLWVHSPTAISEELIAETNNLGAVAHIVGPNNAHNLYLKEWLDHYPEAQLYVSPGIPKKLKLSGNYIEMGQAFDNPWADDLARVYMPGVSFFDESVFLHKESKSLILTDFIMNFDLENPTFIQRTVLRLIGFKDICIAPPLKFCFMFKDRKAFNQSVQQIKAWEFDRIVVTHGEIIEQGAAEHLQRLAARFS